jgi:hypothetical protein
MSLWPEGALTRDDVEDLLQPDTRWTLTYCFGAHVPSVSGRGRSLPPGVLAAVPSRIQKRRIERGKSDKTYFYAQVDEDHLGRFLRLTEG